MFNESSRNSNNYDHRWNISCDNSTSANYSPSAYVNSTKYHCVCADPDIVLNMNITDNMTLLSNEKIGIVILMIRRAHDHIRSKQTTFSDLNQPANRRIDMDIHIKGRIIPHHDRAAFSSEKGVLSNTDQAFKADRMRRNELKAHANMDLTFRLKTSPKPSATCSTPYTPRHESDKRF